MYRIRFVRNHNIPKTWCQVKKPMNCVQFIERLATVLSSFSQHGEAWWRMDVSVNIFVLGPDHGLWPVQCQDIAWTNSGSIFIEISGTKPSEIWIKILNFSSKKMQLMMSSAKWRPFHTGARFTNDFLLALQIRWKFCLVVIPLLAIRSQQFFAHVTTVQLSCHVQTFATITVLESIWERNEISNEFELRCKSL